VVLGHVSPSGRTPVTWARAQGQVPIFFGERPSGRPADPNDRFTSKYLDVSNDPLFPFGFGLTYGRFTHSNLRVPPGSVVITDTVAIRVDVTNDGERAAEDTVFLFTHDRLASVSRPVLELRGFGKITLGPGETGTVTLLLAAAELRFLAANLAPVFEAGEVEILVGACADRRQLLAASIRLSAARDR
jgi:beta-glucosidase